MKKYSLIWISLFLSMQVFCSKLSIATSNKLAEIEQIFIETKRLCSMENGLLWGQTLDVPILFVDKENGQIYTNTNSAKLEVSAYNNIYTGSIPNFLPIVKGPAKIDKRMWAIIPLPLPNNAIERQCLIVHEAFHCVQTLLKLNLKPYDNRHMNEMEARFWMKLEWKALELALKSKAENRKQSITDAVCFRNYRRALYSDCDKCENRFEIHEGMAEYTAQKICRTNEEFKTYLQDKLEKIWYSDSFVNCFAYYTGPVYAYLLDQTEMDWRINLGATTNIANLTITAYNISLPFDIYMEAEERSAIYKGAQIMGEELDRTASL